MKHIFDCRSCRGLERCSMFIRFLAIILVLVSATAAAAQSGYQIKSGDQLAIEVLEDPSLNRSVLVLPDGTVSFPLVGSVGASGKSVDAFRGELAQALAPNFATAPTIFVAVAGLGAPKSTGTGRSRISIYLLGEVEAPGELEVRRGTTLLQALSQSGGFTRFAATKRIQLRRADPATGEVNAFQFNFRAIERGAPISGKTVLADGDVIIVPQRRLFE